MIEAHELTECYGDIHAVHSLSVTIAPGTVTGFLGPNGAGKSTTMRMIMRSMAAPHNIKASRVSEVIEMTGLAGVATKRVGGFSLGIGPAPGHRRRPPSAVVSNDDSGPRS